VIERAQLATRLQHAKRLAEHAGDRRHAAQDQAQDDGVEALIGERERQAVTARDPDSAADRERLLQRDGEEVRVRLDRVDLGAGPVVAEVAAGAAADLEDAAGQIANQLAAHVGEALLVDLDRHQVGKLGRRVLLLQRDELLRGANEMGDLFEHDGEYVARRKGLRLDRAFCPLLASPHEPPRLYLDRADGRRRHRGHPRRGRRSELLVDARSPRAAAAVAGRRDAQ
jgi:hypothetical protein